MDDFRPVIPAKAGIQKSGGRYSRALVRIKIYGIIGFSGFHQRVFERQALIPIPLDGISNYCEKRNPNATKS